MDIKNENFTILTKGFEDSIDITDKIINFVKTEYIENGLINIFVSSSTSGLIITEDEPGIIEDINKRLSVFFPVNSLYQHDISWHEGNGYSYLKAAFFAKNISIPIMRGDIMLNKYQKIFLLDFDTSSSSKKITVTLIRDNG